MNSEIRRMPSGEEVSDMIDRITDSPQEDHNELEPIHHIAEHPEDIAEINFALMRPDQMQELHDEIVEKDAANKRFASIILEAMSQSGKPEPNYAKVNEAWAALAAQITEELPAPGSEEMAA